MTATAESVVRPITSSAATVNAVLAFAGSRKITRISGVNRAGYFVFLRLYDKATAPDVGTDVPFSVIPWGSNVQINLVRDVKVTRGLGVALTKGVAENDATAVAAGDVYCLEFDTE